MRIAVMGAGGLGGYFGGRLVHAGLDVTFIARGLHLSALREKGLQVLSPLGDFSVHPVATTDDPAAIGPVDLVLFCVKAYDAETAAAQTKPLMGAHTAVIPVLNGIDHIALLQQVLGRAHVMGGLAAITAHKHSPGVIEHTGAAGGLEFGELDGSLSPRCETIGHELSQAGFAVSAVRNIKARMWWKLVILSGAGLCSVVRADMGIIFNTPETTALARRAMLETVAVARAQGVALDESLPDELVLALKDLHGDRPSMLIDLEHGRRLEVAWLNGAVARLGSEKGVPTPVNEFIVACLTPWANGRLPANQF